MMQACFVFAIALVAVATPTAGSGLVLTSQDSALRELLGSSDLVVAAEPVAIGKPPSTFSGDSPSTQRVLYSIKKSLIEEVSVGASIWVHHTIIDPSHSLNWGTLDSELSYILLLRQHEVLPLYPSRANTNEQAIITFYRQAPRQYEWALVATVGACGVWSQAEEARVRRMIADQN